MSAPNGHAGGWVTPAPAGLTAYAVACFTFFAVLSGQVTHAATPMLAFWLFGGLVVQLCVGLIELKEGHVLGGNVFLFFSGFFMLAGGGEFLVSWIAELAGKPESATAAISGWAWLVLTITLILWTPCYMKTSSAVMGVLLLTLDVAVVLITFAHKLKWLGAEMDALLTPISGWVLLISGILAIYQAASIQINAAWGKTILPVGPSLIK